MSNRWVLCANSTGRCFCVLAQCSNPVSDEVHVEFKRIHVLLIGRSAMPLLEEIFLRFTSPRAGSQVISGTGSHRSGRSLR